MDGDTRSVIRDLQRINTGLTQQLCYHQDVIAKLNRQLFYANEDLKTKDKQLEAKDRLLLQLQQPPQRFVPPPNALFHDNFMAAPPELCQPLVPNNNFMEHRTAGTLLSPSKKGRHPLSSLESNAPLKLSDLPPRKAAAKRAPLNLPPAKQIQKKASQRPTPEKFTGSFIAKRLETRKDVRDVHAHSIHVDEQAKKEALRSSDLPIGTHPTMNRSLLLAVLSSK